MDGWIKIPKKRENTTQKPLVRDLHAADVRYHLDCLLGVTKIQACWSGAIVTTISSIIY